MYYDSKGPFPLLGHVKKQNQKNHWEHAVMFWKSFFYEENNLKDIQKQKGWNLRIVLSVINKRGMCKNISFRNS